MSQTIGCVKPISVTTDSTVVMRFTSSSSINSLSDLSSTAVLGDKPARLHLEEDKRKKNPCIWALVSHSSQENTPRSLPVSPLRFCHNSKRHPSLLRNVLTGNQTASFYFQVGIYSAVLSHHFARTKYMYILRVVQKYILIKNCRG